MDNDINIQDLQLNNVKRILDEYALKFEELIKKKITDNDKKSSGNLLASIHTSIEVGNEKYTVYLHSKEYLKYIELGTKPFWPPEKPIIEWIKQKNLPTKESTGDKSLPSEKSLSFLIRRSIAGKSPNQQKLKNPNGGIQPPVPLIAETEEELNAIYTEKLEQALIEDIKMWLPIITISLRFK